MRQNINRIAILLMSIVHSDLSYEKKSDKIERMPVEM